MHDGAQLYNHLSMFLNTHNACYVTHEGLHWGIFMQGSCPLTSAVLYATLAAALQQCTFRLTEVSNNAPFCVHDCAMLKLSALEPTEAITPKQLPPAGCVVLRTLSGFVLAAEPEYKANVTWARCMTSCICTEPRSVASSSSSLALTCHDTRSRSLWGCYARQVF